MAGYKITKKDGYYTYTAPGHNECKCTRLHDPQDVDGGRLINGLTHFLLAAAQSSQQIQLSPFIIFFMVP